MVRRCLKPFARLFSSAFLASSVSFASGQSVVINEIVTDPQQDRTGEGAITPSDEYTELYNFGNSPVTLTNWTLILDDTTPAQTKLAGIIPAHGYCTIRNPVGAQNNDGALRLYDAGSNLVDSVTYGVWNGLTNLVPNGNASGLATESLSRFPDGSTNWVKTYATPDAPNRSPHAHRLSGHLSNALFMVRCVDTNFSSTNRYVIEHSLDLRTWEPAFLTPAGVPPVYTTGIGATRGFFRTKFGE